MGLNQLELTTSFLQDEITIAKKIRSPRFDIEELQGKKAKYVESVAKKIINCAAKHQIDTFFLARLFLRHAFPASTSHTAIHLLESTWGKFIEIVFDDECLLLCRMTLLDASIDSNLNTFFKNWNSIADSLSKAYQTGSSSVFIEKLADRDFRSYKTALKFYHFIRPYSIISSVFGDVILDKTALYTFIRAAVDTKRIFQAKLVLAFLVKKDPLSSKFFVESMEKEYINIHKNDPTMKNKDLKEVAPTPSIKRDNAAINKIRG
jgi:hypothetical protein